MLEEKRGELVCSLCVVSFEIGCLALLCCRLEYDVAGNVPYSRNDCFLFREATICAPKLAIFRATHSRR